MIQRVQSLYLLLIATIAICLIFLNPLYAEFKNDKEGLSAKLGFTTTEIYDMDKMTPVPKWINVLVLIFIGIGSVLAIFLFKKRELQKKLCIYLTLLSALLAIFMVLDYNTMRSKFPDTSTYPGIWSVLPVLIVIFGFLAWRGIRKDENLLKSMDRIR